MNDSIKLGLIAATGIGATDATVQSVAPDWGPVFHALILGLSTLIPLIVIFAQAELRTRIASVEQAPPAPMGPTGPMGPVGPAAPAVIVAPVAPVPTPTVESLLTQVLAELQSQHSKGV